MSKELVMKKPSVSSTTWSRRYHNNTVEVYESDRYHDFYKVVVHGQKPKYFFGESAWSEAQVYALDNSHHKAYFDIYNSI